MIGRVGSNPPILQSTSSKNICSEQFLLMPQWHEGYSAISSGCCFQSLGGFRRLVIHREWAANQRSQNFHGFEVVHIDMLSFVTILQQMELCSKSVPFLFCNTDRVRAASRHRSVVHVGDMEQWRVIARLVDLLHAVPHKDVHDQRRCWVSLWKTRFGHQCFWIRTTVENDPSGHVHPLAENQVQPQLHTLWDWLLERSKHEPQVNRIKSVTKI